MGKGEGAPMQPAMQSVSAGLPARAGEGLSSGCSIDPIIRSDESTENSDNSKNSDADIIASVSRNVKCANKSPTLRRPLSNEYKRLDNLVLLKQEIKKLHAEMKELREGERRRLDDMRSQSEAYKAQLQEITKLNNRESLKLMCELRSKDRIIMKLEKEMGQLRTYCDKLSAKQREEPVVAAKKSKKQEMPPHTAKDRAELSRVDTERGLDQPPAPPEPPDTGPPGLSLTSDDKMPWRTRPEEKRRKLRNTGRSILEFINSELLASEPSHKTVVFIGDETDQQVSPVESLKEVLRIDIPSVDIPIKHSESVCSITSTITTPEQNNKGTNDSLIQREIVEPKATVCTITPVNQTNKHAINVCSSKPIDINNKYALNITTAQPACVTRAASINSIKQIDTENSTIFPAKLNTHTQSVQTNKLETIEQIVQTQIDNESICLQTDQIKTESQSVQTEPELSESVVNICDGSDESSTLSSPTEIQNNLPESVNEHLDNKQNAEEINKNIAVCNAVSTRLPSRLPVLERSKSEDLSSLRSSTTTHILTKVVSLETLYGVLMEEHLGLVTEAREQLKRSNLEKQRLNEAEIKLKEATQALETLQKSNRDLETRLVELTEENDLLEFRLLEIEEQPPKRAVSRGSETRWDLTEVQDDISDSGLMSLPTSEDEQYSLCSSEGSSEVIKCRLLSMCRHTESPTEKTCLEDTIALLRHYENRLQQLDSTLSSARYGESPEIKGGRIVATVPPFSSGESPRGPEIRHKEIDPLQESGIFEETQYLCRATQTDVPDPPGDLSQEIQKLVQIRECIEENKTVGSETRELLYLRDRLAVLEHRIRQYEALPQHKDTKARLELEAALRAQVQRFEERVEQLEEENTKLEEICSELEEQENDTRLRCQKLEAKVSSLGEKKIGLKAQLELNARTIAELKNSLMEEERKRNEARQAAAKLEGLVHQYEKKNFELEERETEVRYTLQVLESTIPAIMMWNMWRMMAIMQIGEREKENEMVNKLKTLESQLANENNLLEQSRKAELELKEKLQKLEELLDCTDQQDYMEGDISEKIDRISKEKQEKDKRIQELELREKLYQETLQQADSMFAEMESDYTKQISEKDILLRDKELQLSESETKMKRLSKERESTSHLHDKLHVLETDLKSSKEQLSRKEQERAALKYEEERLRTELNSCLDEIQSLKTTLSYTRSELDGEKKSTKQLKELMDKQEYESANAQQEHEIEVNKFKKQIKKLGMELMESEVTIGELKEEVQALEVAVKDLKEELRLEKDKTESLRVRLESELEESCRRIELLEENKNSDKSLSLRDELNMSTWQQVRTETEQVAETSRPVPAARTTSTRRIKKLIERIEQSIPTPQPRKIKENLQT